MSERSAWLGGGSTGQDPRTDAGRLLEVLGEELDGHPGVDLELSVRLQPGGVQTRGRFGCWLAGAGPASCEPITRLLERLAAPATVRAAQRAAERPVRQGVAVSFGGEGPELRLYLHGRGAALANHYQAFRWRPGAEARRSIYAFHFLPETPSGLRPLDLVGPSLRRPFEVLLAEPRLVQSSGFWLREGEDGALEQVDLAFPWSPPAESLPGLHELARSLEVPVDERWRSLPVRHVAVPAGAARPSASLYVSAPRTGPWPRSEADLHDQVCRGAMAVHHAVEEQVFARLPSLPAERAVDGALDGFYDGEIAIWRAVLGPELHYHAGLFTAADLRSGDEPGDEAMEIALRRAVEELHPFLRPGGRIYDVGCGWGGPLAMWIRDLGCVGLGLTGSRAQFRHVAALGLPVRHGDAEHTLPPGRFDCVVLLESLSHIVDKERLLRVLRPFTDRLVMRVNCQDGSPPGPAFGGTMHMISSIRLREIVEASGFRIRHWRDRRAEALPSVAVWHRRLRSVPVGTDRHLETLRAWCARIVQAPHAWGRHNPLIEIVAD